MECREARSLIDPYIDEELPLERVLEIEGHLASCPSRPSCAAVAEARHALGAAIRRTHRFEGAPAPLRQRIAAQLPPLTAEAAPAQPSAHMVADAARRTGGMRAPDWLRLAAAIVLSLGLGAGLAYYAKPPGRDSLQQEVLASHVRALLSGTRLIDVVSADERVVKPWFHDKLDYVPPVFDLTDKGFPLGGARADYVNGRTVAAIVYRRRQHVITLFVWPNKGAEKGIQTSELQGEHIANWADDDMTYWVVSDLNADELGEFCKLFLAADEAADRAAKKVD